MGSKTEKSNEKNEKQKPTIKRDGEIKSL